MDKMTLINTVRAAQAGDREAFGRLVAAYQKVVLAVTERKLGNYAEAEELTQDVFIHAMQKIGQLENPAAFGGWLRSIATRMAINKITRQRSALPTDQEVLENTCVDGENPMDEAVLNERSDQLHRGLARLREMDRETLKAFYIDGDSIDEMSSRFDAPVGTIKRRLHMARKRLADELGEIAAV